MDQLLEEVAVLRNNTVATNSRAIYLNSMVKFIIWLSENYATLMNPLFLWSVEQRGGVNRTVVKEIDRFS